MREKWNTRALPEPVALTLSDLYTSRNEPFGFLVFIKANREHDGSYGDGWFIAPYDLEDKGFKPDDYGITWLAYNNKPKDSTP